MLGLVAFAMEVEIVIEMVFAALLGRVEGDDHVELAPSFLLDLERSFLEG